MYPGLYIKDIAQEIINKNDNLKFDNFDKDNKLLKNFSLEESMILIKKDLSKLGIYHDNFYSETKMIENNLVENAVKKLKDKKYVEEGYLDPPKGESIINWKKTKRLILSQQFWNDTNKLQKNDGSWTYFANDVAYHMDKINRNFQNLINILGADHTGYIKEFPQLFQLSNNKIKLQCEFCQLVKLYKNGKPFKMSKGNN